MFAARHPRQFPEHTAAAFTLIELLIVVLIIAILAAIAVPNFLEFQTRAKYARVKNDLRQLATALEAYYVDQGFYLQAYDTQASFRALIPLSTPVAYLSDSYLIDPFGARFVDGVNRRFYGYSARERNGTTALMLDALGAPTGDVAQWYYLLSIGPDFDFDSAGPALTLLKDDPDDPALLGDVLNTDYDPTNGSVSNGDVHRVGGELRHGGQHLAPFWN